MAEPVVSLARVHQEADAAARVAASSRKPAVNPYPANSDAAAAWFRHYCTRLLAHSAKGER